VASAPNTATVNLVVTWGGAKTTTVPVLIQKYSRIPVRGELTKFEAILQPTGAVVEA